MPLTAVENFNTGGITTDARSEESTAIRTFTVTATDDAGAAIASTELEAVQACVITTGSVHPFYLRLLCTDFQCVREANHLGVFRVTFNYKTPETITPDLSDGGDGSFTGVSLNYRGKFEKLWRVDANPEAKAYDGDADEAEDIGGTPIDTFGEIERTTLIVKGQVQITNRVPVNVVYDSSNYLTTINQFVGTRNRGRFLGADEGQLLYVGAASRRIDQTIYEITHTLEFDRFKHQEQIVKPGIGPFGKQFKKDASSKYNNRAFPVWWVQPYPLILDFNALGINIG